MIIYVKTPSARGVVPLQVKRSTSVESIAATIWDKSEVNLWLGGTLLQGSQCVADTGMGDGSMLHLTVPLVGGATVKKTLKGAAGKKKKKDGDKKLTGGTEVYDDKFNRMEESDMLKKLAIEQRHRLMKKLEVERKHTKTNRHRLLNQWRKIQRQNKVEYLRKDIEILSQNHERDVDRKDAWVVLLDRDLEEAEEQFQMALRSHLQNIDALIDIQDGRLLGLEKEFEKELRTLETEFKSEEEAIRKLHEKDRKSLLDIMAAVEAAEFEREAEAKQEHEQTREEIKNKNEEDTNVLRLTLEGIIDELENHFESAHLNYLQNTDQRTQDFKRLTRKDEELSEEIEIKIRKIDRLQKKIRHWRTKISQHGKECKERNNSLRAEKDVIATHFQELKTKMNQFRNGQSNRLSALTRNARSCKKALDDKIALAERILTLAELARKYETEREKILPFYTETSLEEEEEKEGEKGGTEGKHEEINMALGSGGEGEVIHPYQSFGVASSASGAAPIEEWRYLDNFYKKYNKVMLDKLSLAKEKERLEQENQDLQDILKQYLDGISVNEDVLGSNNPLLVVNFRVNLNAPPVRRAAPAGVEESHIAVVEGNHMVGTRRVS